MVTLWRFNATCRGRCEQPAAMCIELPAMAIAWSFARLRHDLGRKLYYASKSANCESILVKLMSAGQARTGRSLQTRASLFPVACADFTNRGVARVGHRIMRAASTVRRHTSGKECRVSQAYTGISNIE